MTENQNIYLGLDIGSSRLSAALCEVTNNEELQLKGVGTHSSVGFERGKVVDFSALKDALQETIEQAEADANCKTNKVFLSISSEYLKCFHHSGLLLSEDESGQISYQDKINVIKQSKNVALPSDTMLLHAIPLVFRVDSKVVQNPVGVFGKKLEVQTYIVLVRTEIIQELKRMLNDMGYTIKGFVFDVLAAGQVMLLSKERKDGAVLVDIGGSRTRISLFKHSLLCNSWDIPIGGSVFSSDISACLKLSFSEAERMKILYGDALVSRISQDEILDITSEDNSDKQIKRLLLAQILEARCKELLSYIAKTVTISSDSNYQLVFGGGGSLLKGMLELGRDMINDNVRDGLPDSVKGIIESSTYSTAVGLVLYGLRTNAITYKAHKQPILKRCLSWVKQFS